MVPVAKEMERSALSPGSATSSTPREGERARPHGFEGELPVEARVDTTQTLPGL